MKFLYRMVKQLCMSLVDFAMKVDSLGADWRIPHLDSLISITSRSKRWTSTSSLGIDHLRHVIFHGTPVDWSGSRRRKRRKRIRPRSYGSYGLPMAEQEMFGLGSYGVLNEIKPSNMWIESDRTLRKG